MTGGHTPVLLEETLELLRLGPGMRVVDATVGCGGHAAAIMERIGPRGVLIGFEWDGEALALAAEKLRRKPGEARLLRRNFAEMKRALADEAVGEVDAVLFDLGMSSLQLDDAARGFSFNAPSPLDMRMDRRRSRTAAAVLGTLGERAMERLLRELGEEKLARRISREILRRGAPGGTVELAELIAGQYRRAGRRSAVHPATRVFQALRIAVNDELENLRSAIPQGIGALRSGGRIAVISFHSLEDRIVKEAFARAVKGCICPPRLPQCRCGGVPAARAVTRKPVRPSAAEVAANPRSRSARLRVAEKI